MGGYGKGEKQTVTKADVGEVPAEVVDKTPQLTKIKQELEAKRDELREKMKPFREFYEQHVNDPKYLECCKQIKELSKELGPIENELAALVRVDSNYKGGIKVEPGEYKRQ